MSPRGRTSPAGSATVSAPSNCPDNASSRNSASPISPPSASRQTAGATGIAGDFHRGDLVTVEGPAGTIARGLSEYDAAEARRLLGRRSDEHAAILGYAPRAALVHRNHLALL